jgi:hypothetical protein
MNCNKRHKISFLIVLHFFVSNYFYAQSSDIVAAEDSLVKIYQKIVIAKNDSTRNNYNNDFDAFLFTTLKKPASKDYTFDKLKISIVSPNDGSFKMFNWNIPNDDLTNKYYCLVQIFEKNNNEVSVIELKDNTWLNTENNQAVYTDANWYGALYYQIVPLVKKNNKTYILLGWDGNDALSNKKIIETITVGKKNIKFGNSVFNEGKKTKKRVLFEFAKETNFSLKYYPELSSIVFNHLVPLTNQLEGSKSYYVPDLTFDAYTLEGTKWVYSENINFNAPKNTDNNFEKPLPANMNKKRDNINPLTGQPYQK